MAVKLVKRTRPRFTGYTREDGTRKAGAPRKWPFGTVAPPVMRAKPKIKRKKT